MKKINYILGLALLIGALFTSCEDDDPIFSWDYKNGVIIIEEGSESGSISAIETNSSNVTNNVYSLVNGTTLGKYVQSGYQVEDKGYFISNGSNKMTIVDLNNITRSKIITNLSYPRYAAYDGNSTVYISNGTGTAGDDYIFVFDSKNEIITDSISTRIGPNALEFNNDKLFVLHYGGLNYGSDSFMTVINTKINEIEKVVELAVGPADLVIDANENIWVICNHWSKTTSTLFKVNGTTLTVEQEFVLTEKINSYGSNLLAISPDKKTIYLEANGVMAIDYNATSLPTTRLIDGTSAYGLSVDPENGDIWVIQNNTANVYDNNGNSVSSYAVGTYANNAVFLD